MEEEMLYTAAILKQRAEELEKQLDFVKQQIFELEQFKESLKILEENKENEMLSNLGKGVFMKTKREENEKLFVEVGAGVVVRKTPKETREVITNQLNKLNLAKIQLGAQLEEFAEEFKKMLEEVEKLREKANKE